MRWPERAEHENARAYPVSLLRADTLAQFAHLSGSFRQILSSLNTQTSEHEQGEQREAHVCRARVDLVINQLAVAVRTWHFARSRSSFHFQIAAGAA